MMAKKLARAMKGLRTVGFNLAVLVLSIISVPEVLALIPLEWMPLTLAAVAVGNILLRAVTTTPLGKKD